MARTGLRAGSGDVSLRHAGEDDGDHDTRAPVPSARPGGAANGDGRAGRALDALAVVVHGATLAGAGVLIVWTNRRQWFFGDEWEFFANRLEGGGRVLFAPHNEHWSTVPILIYRALYEAAGLRTYVPYVAVLVVAHLAVVHLVWRVMRRTGTPPLIASALAAVLAVLGSGSENLLWAFQIGFVGSVALGLVHILLVDHDGRFGRRDVLGWAVAVVGLACSGIAVTMTAVAGLVVLLRRNLNDAVLTVVPPAGVYLLWLAWIGHEGLRDQGSTLDRALGVPSYLWTGLSFAVERGSGIPGAGPALVVLLLVWLVRQDGLRSPAAAVPTAMAVGAGLLFAVIGMGRSNHGVEQATSSRYVYIAVALLLPAIGLALSSGVLRAPARQAAVAALLGLVLLQGLDDLRTSAAAEGDRERQIRAQVMAADQLVASGEALVGPQPEPRYTPDLTVDVLRRLRADGALPAGVEVTDRDRLAAATQLQLAVTTTAPAPAGTPSLPTLAGRGVAADGAGCAVLPSGAGAELRLAGP
ncbi:MAG: hypothetical protein ACRD0N_03620, partial [Acidimicrobiales bacterium]